MNRLAEVDVSGTRITSAGLARVLRPPALRWLYIAHCDGIPDARLIELLTGGSEVEAAAAAEPIAIRAYADTSRRDAFVQEGVLSALAALRVRGSAALQSHAATAIAHLAQVYHAYSDEIVAAGCLQPLAALLSHSIIHLRVL